MIIRKKSAKGHNDIGLSQLNDDGSAVNECRVGQEAYQ